MFISFLSSPTDRYVNTWSAHELGILEPELFDNHTPRFSTCPSADFSLPSLVLPRPILWDLISYFYAKTASSQSRSVLAPALQ